MYRKMLLMIVVVSVVSLSTMSQAAPVDITQPGDPVQGVPDDSDWPGNEAPPLAIDDNTATKYLHFKGDFDPDPGTGGAGFQVTPSKSQSIVTGMSFTTANDAVERDPTAFELYGSNDSIDGPYTFIASGDIVDFNQPTAWPRFTINETPISFSNNVPYDHYQILFPDIRVRAGANSMQISEVELFGISFTAYGPVPADGSFHEDTWASLSWTPGDTAVSHDVYFGDNFDAVDAGAEGTFFGNQVALSFVVGFPGFPFPDGLVPGATYYWRIDEIEADGTTIHKGIIWSFMIPPKTAYLPDPADNAESVELDASLSWAPGFSAKLHTVYFGDNFDDVNNAAGGLPQGFTTFNPGPLELAKTYYWRVDEFDPPSTHTGSVWSFITQGAVGSPIPAKGAVDITQTPVLTWTPGVFADTHEVFFGTDATSLENKGSGNLGSESYEPGLLEWDTTYYWRIDETNNANADSPWTGPLWNFTTANFLIVDDMESYNDLDPADPASNRIFNVWIDGFDNPTTNGSVVGHANAPFAEQTIVHSGLQSMPMSYDNAVGKSEATLTLTSNRDWTVNGVNTLTIWYRGDSDNAAETMYVALNDSAVVNNDNPDAALMPGWTQWNIDLQSFADQGVNLTNINSIALGLGNRSNPVAGGAGMMYYDDIRLNITAP
ncbi:MAG: hypothetical protein GY774_37820 [Planctomycetes bacterium]|nr:hypothetical protein [Planctomycetota bacterium]